MGGGEVIYCGYRVKYPDIFVSAAGFAFIEFYQPQDALRWMEQHKVCLEVSPTPLGSVSVSVIL